jgi:hypothetical protein
MTAPNWEEINRLAKLEREKEEAAKGAVVGNDEEEIEVAKSAKTRNPKLANMMAMMGVEESKGTLFADQQMTPEVPRHKTSTKLAQAEQVIHEAEDRGLIDKDVDQMMKEANKPQNK